MHLMHLEAGLFDGTLGPKCEKDHRGNDVRRRCHLPYMGQAVQYMLHISNLVGCHKIRVVGNGGERQVGSRIRRRRQTKGQTARCVSDFNFSEIILEENLVERRTQ